MTTRWKLRKIRYRASLTALGDPAELRDGRRHLAHPRGPLLPLVLVLLRRRRRALVLAQPPPDAARVHAAHPRLQDPHQLRRWERWRRPPPRPARRGPAQPLLAPARRGHVPPPPAAAIPTAAATPLSRALRDEGLGARQPTLSAGPLDAPAPGADEDDATAATAPEVKRSITTSKYRVNHQVRRYLLLT